MKYGLKGTFVLALVAIAAAFMLSTPALARDKIVVGVASFADESNKNLGGKATDAVVNTFVELKYFRVVERNRMDQLMNEVAHQQTGFVDASTAGEIGRQLGAQAMVLGSVGAAGYHVEQNQWTDDDGKVHINYTAKASISLNIRIVEVETSEIVFAETIIGAASDTVSAGSQPQPESVLLGKALQKAAYNMYRPIQENYPLTATVIKVDPGSFMVYIDVGTDWGVKKGRRMEFYRQGEAIRHPTTGKIIGQERTFLLKSRVSKAMPAMSKTKIKKKKFGRIQVGDHVIILSEGVFLH